MDPQNLRHVAGRSVDCSINLESSLILYHRIENPYTLQFSSFNTSYVSRRRNSCHVYQAHICDVHDSIV